MLANKILKCNQRACDVWPTHPTAPVPGLHETGRSFSHRHSCAVAIHIKMAMLHRKNNNINKMCNWQIRS